MSGTMALWSSASTRCCARNGAARDPMPDSASHTAPFSATPNAPGHTSTSRRASADASSAGFACSKGGWPDSNPKDQGADASSAGFASSKAHAGFAEAMDAPAGNASRTAASTPPASTLRTVAEAACADAMNRATSSAPPAVSCTPATRGSGAARGRARRTASRIAARAPLRVPRSARPKAFCRRFRFIPLPSAWNGEKRRLPERYAGSVASFLPPFGVVPFPERPVGSARKFPRPPPRIPRAVAQAAGGMP